MKNYVFLILIYVFLFCRLSVQVGGHNAGADPGFQVRGGGRALKIIYAKKSYFFNCRGRRENF